MPELCRFYGIVVQMFYKDHEPPHFHITYNEYRAKVSIEDLKLISGKFPRKGLNLILDWAELHQEELLEKWELMKNEKPLGKIEPIK
ncbi:MAG: DUF4160 domain-containing protein [Cytophagales bacterium]|nr:DUF4160 domain-containing protein [Cytophagales bacterium]